MKPITEYSSIIDVVEAFSDEKKNLLYLEKQRWGDNITCPRCGSEHYYRFKDQVRFKCKACMYHFNAKIGTMFEGTKLSLKKWFVAIYLDLVGSKGISSYELAKQLSISQPTAWLLLTNIRANISNTNERDEKFSGIVEVDEAWIGGKMRNMHKKKKRTMTGWKDNKTIVLGMLNRDGKMKCQIVKDRSMEELQPILLKHINRGSNVMTDELSAYDYLKYHFMHDRINHSNRVYCEGNVSTNGVENFWSLLKRGISGVHHHASKKHINKYIQDYVFRFNTRNLNNRQRIELLLRNSDHRVKLKHLKAA